MKERKTSQRRERIHKRERTELLRRKKRVAVRKRSRERRERVRRAQAREDTDTEGLTSRPVGITELRKADEAM